MKKNIIAVIANGEKLRSDFLKKILSDVDTIIAVNGGSGLCYQLSITPDYIIGDLDSVKKNLRKMFPAAEIIPKPDQDSTDLQKALEFAIDLSPGLIKILSPFGKRTDHSMANILIFQQLKTNIKLEIYDNYGILKILKPDEHKIYGKIGKTVSLFSFEPVKNLILKGFKYPITNQDFDRFFLGISNIYQEKECYIKFDDGNLFIYELY